MGISRIVLGKEAFYHNGAFRLEELTDQTFLAASEINQYAKQLSEAGFEVVVIGFDYRYKDPAQNAKAPIRNLFESKNLTCPTDQGQSKLTNDLYANLLSVDKRFLIEQQEKFPSRTGFNKTS
jgi:hypothetical protein